MRLQCGKLKHNPAVFFWDEPCDNKAEAPKGIKKKFKSLSSGEEFDVKDEVGHEIITKYKGQFKVLGYGEAPKNKQTKAAKTAMIKEEKIK